MHCHFAGVLACLDGYMNIALEQTEEYVNGQVVTAAFFLGNSPAGQPPAG